jgi:hypothetical protein
MRATIRTALLVMATLVLLGLTAPAASARGSGRDDRRSGDDFSRRTQGRSPSDPDGMTNGGRDKPGSRGGFSDDRDGNNGCGNDDDREDDNNGNCGRKKFRAAGDGDRRKSKSEDTAVQGSTEDRDDDGDDRKKKCDTIVAVQGATEDKDEKLTKVTVAGTTVSLVCQPKVDAAAVEAALQALIEALGLPVQKPVVQPAVQAAIQAAPLPVSEPAVVPASTELAAAPPADTAVLGAQVEQQPAPAVAPPTQVAGAQESRLGALALTGLAIGGLALLGASLVAIGRLASRAGRT